MGKKKVPPNEEDDRPVDLRGRSLAVERLFVGGRELMRPITETKARQLARQAVDDVLPGLQEHAAAAATDAEARVRADLEALRTAASADLRAAGQDAAERDERIWGRLEDLAAVEAQAGQAADALARHQDALDAATGAVEDLDRTVDELEERVDGLDTTMVVVNAAIDEGRDRLEAHVAATDAGLAEVGERLDGVEEWAGRAEGRIATLEDVSGSLEASLDAHATAFGLRLDARAGRFAADLEAHAATVRGQLVEQEDAMSDLRRVVAAQEPTLHLLRQDVVDLQVAASTFAMYASYRPTPDNGFKLGPAESAVIGWDRPVLRHDSVTVSRGTIRVAKAGYYRLDVSITLLASDAETMANLSVFRDDDVVETLPLHRLRANMHRVYMCALVHATPASVLTVRLENELEAGADPRHAVHFLSSPEQGLLQVQSVRLDRG